MLTQTNPLSNSTPLTTSLTSATATQTSGGLTTDSNPQLLRGSSNMTSLSSLPWTSATNSWGPVEKNQSNGESAANDGRTISLNGVTYSQGLGVHSFSEISYALGGKYSTFRSDIGVDDEAGNNGSVVFQVWADGSKLYDSSVMTGSSATQTVNANVAGKQRLKLVVTNAGDNNDFDHASWANPTLTTAATPTTPTTPTAPSVANGNGNGLTGQYYRDRDLNNPGLTRTDRTVNFDWKGGSPNSAVGSDNFSARWSGQVQPKYSETYTFSTTSDDGVRLWVNGQQLINNWTDHAPTQNNGSITLKAGQKYDIKLEYYEKSGGAVSKLMWSSSSQTKEIIPQSQLYSSIAQSPVLDTNGKPVIMVPGSQSATPNISLPIAGIKVSDQDAGNGNLTVTLGATNGTLTVNSNVIDGISMAKISNNGTGSVILIGTLLQINATLANPNGLVYKPNAGFQGTDRVDITVNDNGNTGAGGAQTGSQFIPVNVAKSGSSADRPTNQNSPLGINLSGIADWSTEWPFVDVFKMSRPWVSNRDGAGWGKGGPLNLTPDGWVASLQPGQSAWSTVMTAGKYPGGNYTLFYDGQGKIEIEGGTIVSQSAGRMVVNVKADQKGVGIKLSETNSSNPIRNIRFVMPGFENTYQTQPFHPTFLDRLSKFKVLRFMDWGATNGSPVKNWSDRTTLNSATQHTEKGAAPEHMIQLANTLKADPWFTIPHQANDDYVRQFANIVRDRLDPSLKVHIEYSNEVWNGVFEQSNYAGQKGMEQKLSGDGWEARNRFFAKRSVEIFKIFEGVLGDDRVNNVISWNAYDPYNGESVLKWNNTHQVAESYAVAPYFYGGYEFMTNSANEGAIAAMTKDQVLDRLMQDVRGRTRDFMNQNQQLVNKYGVDLIAYEGGQHLTAWQFGGQKDRINNLFTEVNRDSRMKDIYKEYLNQWKQSGGGLFAMFSSVVPPGQWGYWGSLEYQNQDVSQAPKYQGMMDFITANPTR